MSDAPLADPQISAQWQDALDSLRFGQEVRLTARWTFPVDADPIENCLITIGSWRTITVERLAAPPDSDVIDLGNSAVLPALFNAHAHLEFSDLFEPIQPPAPFSAWIQNLMAHRRQRTESTSTLAERGYEESGRSGVQYVGDIVTGDWTPPAGSDVVAFREFIGLLPEQHDAQVELANRHIEDCLDHGVYPGLSPHAPYSVSPRLYRSLIEVAKEKDRPLCIHLAETRAELELLDSGTGELVEMLTRFGIWRDDIIPRGSKPLDYLKPLANLNAASIVHGNYLSDEEIEFLGRHPNITTVFCPRTHRFFGHTNHPWQRLLAAGASVALGTDGRSSNPDYSLWAEVLFLDGETDGHARPELLKMATVHGTAAIFRSPPVRKSDEAPGICLGSLIQLGDASSDDPWDALFHPQGIPEPCQGFV